MDAVPAKVLAKFSASHHNHMFFPDEVGFCDPIGGESHVDGFASYEADFESAVPPLFPFGRPMRRPSTCFMVIATPMSQIRTGAMTI